MDLFSKYTYQIAIAACVVVLILIIITVWNQYQHNKLFYNNIQGMWIAPESFCMQSGIDGMMLYIGPDLGGFHKAYLLMYSEGSVAVAKAIEISFSTTVPGLLQKNQITKTANIKTQDSQESLEDIMPNQQTISIDLNNGHMECTSWDDDADEVRKYAEFYRDNISSNSANISE